MAWLCLSYFTSLALTYNLFYHFAERSFKLKSFSNFESGQDSFNEIDTGAADSVFDGLTRDTDGTSNYESCLDNSMDTTTPAWLKNEFDEAEVFI